MAQKQNKKAGERVSLGYAWYALGVLFFINLVNYVDRLSIGPALEHIKRDFSISDAKIGLIAGAFMLVYAILSVPMGYFSDRGSRTRIVAVGAFVWSIATTLSGFCRTFWGFFFARAMVGSGEGIYAPSGTAIVADYFPKRLRNTSIAIFMSAMIVGGAIAYIVAGIILKKTEKFNIPLVENVLIEKGQKELNGWKYTGIEETKKRLVQFNFEGPGGERLSAILSRAKEEKAKDKKADFHSALFNVDYTVSGGSGKKNEETGIFINYLNERITDREGIGLEKNYAPIKALPHALKAEQAGARPSADGIEYFLKGLPAQYRDKLKYLESGSANKGGKEPGKFIYYGVMTKKDRLALDKVSDNENYSKAIGVLYAECTYHYLRSDNWRWIFWILGPPGLLFAFLAFRLREPLKGGSEDFLSEDEARKVEEEGKTDYMVLLRTPSVVIMVLSNILATYCVGGLNIWLFPFVERYKGIESADAAVSFGPIVVGFAVLGVIISGMLADKLQKVTPYGNNIVIVVGIILGIPPMYLFLYTENYFLMIAGISACIFFLTWINGPQNALLMSLVEPRLRAMLNGVHILLIHLLGDFPSPIIIGHYSDVYNLRYALAMRPVFLFLGAVGFAIASIYVPRDLKAVEKRMKGIASGAGAPKGFAH